MISATVSRNVAG